MRACILLFIFFTCVKISNAQFKGKNWSKGSYYDLEGNKHSGYLCWTAPDETSKIIETVIYFKNDVKGNELKINIDSLHSFIIKPDSYSTIDSFFKSHNSLFVQKPVIEVLVSRNPVKLYRSLSFVMSKAVRWADGRITPAYPVLQYDYYFGPNDEQLTLLGENNFYEIMQVIMVDNREAISLVKNKELTFKDIVSLLYVYQYGSLPPSI